MIEHPDHHDAELMLRLYDLRREEKLRRAREWFTQEFHAESSEDFFERFPFGSQENAYFRMTVTYWEMAASIVRHGLINEDLFFENNGEFYAVWARIRHLAPQVRERNRNPTQYHNLEALAAKYEKWLEARAPGAVSAFNERLKQLASGEGAKKK